MSELLYFDNAATTFPKSDNVIKAVENTIKNMCVNTGRGAYTLASNAVVLTDELRNNLLKVAGSNLANQVVLAPSATIALNMLLGGLLDTANNCARRTVYVSPYEHNAVMRPLKRIVDKYGVEVIEMPVDSDTLEIDIDKLEFMYSRKKPDVICVTHVSNVTGYILPVNRICDLAKRANKDVVTIVDGSQALGLIKEPLYENEVIDFYVFAGHKTLGGIFGIGGFICNTKYSVKLISNKDLFEPFICGGTGSDSLNLNMNTDTPQGLECGSVDIVAVAALKASTDEYLEEYHKDNNSLFENEKSKSDRLVEGLMSIPAVRLYLPRNRDNHISIVSFTIEGYQSDDVGMILNEDYNISVRTGYHCAPMVHEIIKSREYGGTVRLSVGNYVSDEAIAKVCKAVEEIAVG